MQKWIFFTVMLFLHGGVSAQELTYNDLKELLRFKDYQIDTFLVAKQYQTETKSQEGDTYYFRWSYVKDTVEYASYAYVSVVDIYVRNNLGRMLRFGTLNQGSVERIVEAMLQDGYEYKNRFEYGEQVHIHYQKKEDKIILKLINIRTKDKTQTIYEIEAGL